MISPPVSARNVVVVTPALDVVVVRPGSAAVRLLAHLPLGSHYEVDAVDVSPDGSHVVVSALASRSESGDCFARTYAIGSDHSVRKVLDGALATFSPDGSRIAYAKYALMHRICFRTHLAVRELASGAERSRPLAAGPYVDGTPPEWPLNWSPDGTRITYVGAAETSVATVVGTWSDTALRPRMHSGLAPVFLDDATVGALTHCCTPPQELSSFPISGNGSTVVFPTRGPIRSIRRDRGSGGLWFTTEPVPYSLWHWSGGRLHHLPQAALVTSG